MKTNFILKTCSFIILLIIKRVFALNPNFHIYLAFGQSNMEGQGPIEEQDTIPVERFRMISTVKDCNKHSLGVWYDAVPPLANCYGKLGPVDYFGRTLIANLPEDYKVGVAVVAVAGCDIQLFEKENYQDYIEIMPDYMRATVSAYGGSPYDRLIEMGLKAKTKGVIKGILLHQGETNSGQTNWPSRIKKIYENILTDLELNAEDVPLLAGEVVQSSVGGCCGGMNKIIDSLPKTIPTAHIVSSKDLEQQGDNAHFTSEGYRILGKRYAEVMLKILEEQNIPIKTNDTVIDNSQTNNTTNEDYLDSSSSDNNLNSEKPLDNSSINKYGFSIGIIITELLLLLLF